MPIDRTLRSPSRLTATSRHRSSNRTLRGEILRKDWPMALGRGAHLSLAKLLSQTARTTCAASRHPPGVSFTCLLAHLLAVCKTVLLVARSCSLVLAREGRNRRQLIADAGATMNEIVASVQHVINIMDGLRRPARSKPCASTRSIRRWSRWIRQRSNTQL